MATNTGRLRASVELLSTYFKMLAVFAFLGVLLLFFLEGKQTYERDFLLKIQGYYTDVYNITTDMFLVRPNLPPSELQLPDLKAIIWPVEDVNENPVGVKDSRGAVLQLPKAFEPRTSWAQRRLLRNLLEAFSSQMFSNDLGDRFMIYGSTLLGSIRHHDFIPWDDAVDLLADVEIRETIRLIMKPLEPHYILHPAGPRDKFFAEFIDESMDAEDLELSRRTSNHSWGWPYLDLRYYKNNGTHIYDIAPNGGKYYVWPVNVVFPLYFRPFGMSWYPAPRSSVEFTRMTYRLNLNCVTNGYSHMLEAGEPSISIPCRKLNPRYAFVSHRLCRETVLYSDDDQMTVGKETLFFLSKSGSTVNIHQICLPVDRQNAVVDTYSMERA